MIQLPFGESRTPQSVRVALTWLQRSPTVNAEKRILLHVGWPIRGVVERSTLRQHDAMMWTRFAVAEELKYVAIP